MAQTDVLEEMHQEILSWVQLVTINAQRIKAT